MAGISIVACRWLLHGIAASNNDRLKERAVYSTALFKNNRRIKQYTHPSPLNGNDARKKHASFAERLGPFDEKHATRVKDSVLLLKDSVLLLKDSVLLLKDSVLSSKNTRLSLKDAVLSASNVCFFGAVGRRTI